MKKRKFQNYHQIKQDMVKEATRTGRTIEGYILEPGKRRR